MEDADQEVQEQALADLFAALSAAQGAVSNVVPSGHASLGSGRDYTYATLDKVLDEARKALADNGLSITIVPVVGGVQTTLAHKSGQQVVYRTPYPVAPQAPQAMGSLLTYMRRYITCGILGIAADRDDDAAAAEAEAKAIRAHQDAYAEAGDLPPKREPMSERKKPAIPEDVQAARRRFYSLWRQCGYDPRDKEGMESLLREAVGNPELWFSKASPAQLDKATALLRSQSGLLSQDDGPFSEEE